MNLRVRIGPDDYLLVARRDVLDLRDRGLARAFVEGGGGPPGLDPEPTALDAVVQALASGELVPVRLDPGPRLMRAPEPRPLLDPGEPLELPPAPALARPVQLEVVHETGGLFVGARFVVELPDGELVDGILDERSRWIHPGRAGDGPCTIRFYEPLHLTEDEQRRPSRGPCAPGADDLTTPVGTAAELSLRPGRASRLVVRIPPPVPVVGLDAGVFVPGQAFVTPGIAAALDGVAEAVRDRPQVRVTALATANADPDPQRDPQRDKDLSDRRAQALVTVLTNDEEAFEALVEAEGWSLRHHQAMLRGLGCNPAAIDDIDGPLTQRAVRWFQDEWSRGVHHPDGPDQPLPVTGTLDAATRRALHRAYLLSLSPQLVPEQLAGPGGALGCGAFTLPTSSPTPSPTPAPTGPASPPPRRRGSLALWPRPPSPARPFPCRAGEPGACWIDDRHEHRRCRFERETFEPAPSPAAPDFHDFDWLRLPSGSFNLSAITSLPDGTHVRVHVIRDVQDYDGHVHRHHGPTPLPQRGTPVGPPVGGIVRYGVCVALWSPPDGWDPLAWRDWWTDLEPPDGREPDTDALFHPPLFAIEYDGGWAFSRPPGERIDRFELRHAQHPGLALANDGRFVAFTTTSGHRVVTARERRADEHLQIIGWCSQQRHLTQSEGSP